MAKHTWNSTPPRLWPLARLAAEHSWTIHIDRPTEAEIRLILERDPTTDPVLTAFWTFHFLRPRRPARHPAPAASTPGRWKLHSAWCRPGAGRRVRANLRDLPRLILEADHAA